MAGLSARDVLITGQLAQGIPQREIAKEFGVSQQYVSVVNNKDEARDIINSAHQRLVTKTLSKAVDNLDYAVQSYRKTKSKQLKDHGYKASEKVLESMGLLTSHAQSIVHQTYIQQQTNVINPIINELINKHFEGFALDKPVWEIEDKGEER
jgi:predicted XRE-type DNA-binding protein